jgi:alkylation response protein AidB-like acyl-CoA dehydrogenase
MGFSADTPMESAWRDARIGRIYEGTNEINRMLSVGMLLKKGLKGQIDLMTAVMKAAAEMGNVQKSAFSHLDTPLAQERHLIHNFKQLFLMIAGNAAQKFGVKLEENQQVLLALSDILIETYFAESGLLRTLKNIEKNGLESQEIQMAMVQCYVYEAYETINQRAKEVIINISTDEEQNQLLTALKTHCDYRTYPNIIELKNKIADSLIKENNYYL